MLYAYVAVGLAGVAAGFGGAWQVQAWRYDSAQLEQIERKAKDTFRNVERQDTAVGDYTKDQSNAKVIYQRIVVEVDKIVDRPVYVQQCFDDDGLMLLNKALDGGAVPPTDSPRTAPK